MTARDAHAEHSRDGEKLVSGRVLNVLSSTKPARPPDEIEVELNNLFVNSFRRRRFVQLQRIDAYNLRRAVHSLSLDERRRDNADLSVHADDRQCRIGRRRKEQ